MADVRVDVDLDTAKAEGEAKNLKAKLGGVFGDMGKVAGGIFVANLGASIGQKGVDTLKNSIGLARDFNEIQSKSNTIFDEASGAINKWASSASTGFGQSKGQALDAAATFGNMFSQLGLGADVTADMSMKMTELASDFASFHNADISDVLNAQQAAFRGEYDAVQRFVPTINAAAVEMKALEQTGKTATSELTQQEKAVAVYALMMEGAGKAAGDFDRTQGSLSNQQRILKAQWTDLQTQIGQALIPALTAIVTAINTQVVPAVKDFAADVKVAWEQDIKPAIDNMRRAWEQLSPVIIPILTTIGNHIKNLATILKDTVQLILAIISGDWGRAWDEAKQIVGDFVKLIKDDIEGIKDIITGAIPLVVSAMTSMGSAMAGALRDAFSAAVGFITDIINGIIDAYNSTAGRIPGVANIPRIGGGGGGGSTSQQGAPVPGGDDDQMPGRQVFGLEGAGGGGGGTAGPTGAYGQGLVQDGGAWVYPWEVGSNLPQRIYDWMKSPGFGFTGGNQPIHITLNVDGRVLAEVVTNEMARAY